MVFCRDKANAGNLLNLINEIKEMLANIFDPVQKCFANWTTRSNMYQHSPTSLPTFANKVNKPSQHVVPTMLAQCWPTCCDGLNWP